MRRVGDVGSHHEAPQPVDQCESVTSFVLAAAIILPVGVILLSFFFGGILALGEGWCIMDGFYYIGDYIYTYNWITISNTMIPLCHFVLFVLQ